MSQRSFPQRGRVPLVPWVRFVLSMVFLAMLIASARPAYADVISDLTEQLDDSDYKVRLSAVLGLSKLADPKTTQPLIRALKDSEKTVRSSAASALGKLIKLGLSGSPRTDAIKALEVAKSDKDAGVRKQAVRALADAAANPETGNTGSSSGGATGAVYIDIGDMATKDASVKSAMTAAVKSGLRGSAPSWASGEGVKAPKGTKGFQIGGSVTELSEKVSGGATRVSCKISMFIATYPEKSMFGFLSGGASLEATGSEAKTAKEDCVAAVVEDLVSRKVVPTIKIRSGQ